jgi:L-ascorbate metabolism protein UlaG (beta-lactamase superfamily)
MDKESSAGVFLRSDTRIEPLSCRWYAWPHLISPVQHALNIAFRQIPILKSFLSNPSVHEAACRDPTFLGAPFIHLSRDNAAAMSALVNDTTRQFAGLIQFAEDYMKLERRLQDSAKGFSLDEMYKTLPDSLKGLVELTYDLNNHPSIRIIEELAYPALKNSAMQEIALFRAKDRERKFFLNTPRLPSPERLLMPLRFADERLDVLAQSRIKPLPKAELIDTLNVPAESANRFLEYFTDTPPERKQPAYQGEEVRVRYFGHACVLVQTASTSILTDPLVVCDHKDDEAKLTFDDLPDFIDYVFLTHNHQDHFCPEILLQLRRRIGTILVPRNNPSNVADPSIRLTLKSLGFDRVQVMDPLDKLPIPDGEIVSLPFYGEHADLNIASKQGMYLRIKGRTFLFVADSNCLDPMLYRRIAAHVGKADTLFVGMECEGAPLTWLYSPYLTNPMKRKDDESRRLSGSDSERAWALLNEMGCQRAFVYAMGQEPWLQYLCGLQYTPESKQIVESDKLVERCRSASIPAERLYGCREMLF